MINFVFVHKSSLSFSVLVYSYSMPLYMMLSDKKKKKQKYIIHLTCQPVLCVFVWVCFFFLTADLGTAKLCLNLSIGLGLNRCHIYFT